MTRTQPIRIGSASHIDVDVMAREVDGVAIPPSIHFHANPNGNQAASMAWGRNFTPGEARALADLLLRAVEHTECVETARLVMGDA